jgi:hypothetical protein
MKLNNLPVNTPRSLRHDFVIKSMGRLPGFFKPHRYLYVCMRCKWSFMVNDGRRGVITALDRDRNPLNANEAQERLKTFELGPCPGLAVFARTPMFSRTTQPVRLREVALTGSAEAGADSTRRVRHFPV